MAFLSGEAGPATVSVDSGDSRQMYGHARAHATNALRKWSATKSDTRKTPLTIPVTSPVTKLATESRTTRECETRPLTLTCLIYHAIAHSCSWKHRFWDELSVVTVTRAPSRPYSTSFRHRSWAQTRRV